jgi:branched-chain amino acid transport system substrate-binding protein
MKKRTLAWLSLTVILVLLTGGPASAKDIKTLSQFPMSGPVGSLPEFGMGFTDGTNYINEQLKGVNGKAITFFLEDFRYDPTVEVANFNRYAAEHPKDELLMATGYITGGLKPLIEKVNVEEKIPWLDGSYSTEIFGAEGGPSKYPYYYSLGATYADQIKVLMKWIKENHKGKETTRVGFVYSPTAWGRDGIPEGMAYAKKIGLDVVATIEYPYTATDATTQATTLRKAKAEYVLFHGYSGAGNYTAIFFKTVRKYLPEATIMGTHYTTSPLPMQIFPDDFNGYVGAACRPLMDGVPRAETPMTNKMVKMAHDFAKKYRPDDYAPGGKIRDMGLYSEGLTYALIVHEALTRADKAGALNRAGIKKALDTMVWDFHGLFDGKTFSYKSHTIPMVRIFRAESKTVELDGKRVPKGTLHPLTEWIDTDKVKW